MNQEEKREQLNQIWDSFDENEIDYTEEEFDVIAPKLIEFLITSVLNEDEVYIGTFGIGGTAGSFIYNDEYNRDKRLELYFDAKQKYELKFFICNFKGEEKEYSYSLNENNLGIIPSGLKDIMKEVAKNKKGKKISVKSISQ